jgi:hypothetical protein
LIFLDVPSPFIEKLLRQILEKMDNMEEKIDKLVIDQREIIRNMDDIHLKTALKFKKLQSQIFELKTLTQKIDPVIAEKDYQLNLPAETVEDLDNLDFELDIKENKIEFVTYFTLFFCHHNIIVNSYSLQLFVCFGFVSYNYF